MYLHAFLNMTNVFSHQKIVYRDLGRAKILKNITGTTEKYLIVSSVSEWMGVLIHGCMNNQCRFLFGVPVA